MRKKRLSIIVQLRKDGISKKNQSLLATSTKPSVVLQCQKKSRKLDSSQVICSKCHGVYNETYYYKHKKRCLAVTPEPTQTSTCKSKLLGGRMKKDEYYDIISKDSVLQLIGESIFQTAKPRKERQKKEAARAAMRRLARLMDLMDIKTGNEIFNVDNTKELEDAIEKMCHSDNIKKEEKSGLKVGIGNLLKTCCSILIPHYIGQRKPESATEVENFQKVFLSSFNYARVFGIADYRLKEKSQKETRAPQQLPDEDRVQQLVENLESDIDILEKQVRSPSTCNTSTFVKTRRVCHVYSFFLNGGRGSGCSTLTIDDWLGRQRWIDEKAKEPGDDAILAKYSVVFASGKFRKGKTLVPVVIPRQMNPLLDFLSNPEVRKNAGINKDNKFLFPLSENLKSSLTHNQA